ncbi:MAG: lipoprotein-releasing ABC transporter ATP-binding protein LolD [Gammaproteobacteria bacterium]|nr:lipoprotein-releasing ABC transporter ATP-binding protein LolD [Gammaproteobacteria bacterium]
MSDFSLEAIGLGKAYQEGSGDALHVLSDIDLHLHHGETVAIIGSSGSGKTTLLNTLGGLDEPTTGKVLLNGDDIAKHSEKTRCTIRNKHLGFIYQFHHLLPEFSALENVAMPLLIGGISPEIASQRSEAILGEVGLSQRLHHKPSELSGGERQRAAIARALIHRPDCVLADEPTGNLDRKNAEQAIELIIELNQSYKTALVIVTHDLHIAERMSRIYTLEDGILAPQ